MTSLLDLKQTINNFIGKYEAYLKPLAKFLLALFVLISINGNMGYMDKINNISIVLIAALMCSFMPLNFIVLVGALFVLLHMYALSLECAIVVLVLFVVLFLMYFRLAPRDTVTVTITPILTSMGIPYVMPVAMGLINGPASAASIGCGVIVGRVLKNINDKAEAIMALEDEDMATRLKLVIDSLLGDKVMILLIVAFAITVVVVYIIRSLPIDYSWQIAIAAGSIIDAIIVLVGDMSMSLDVSVPGLLFGTILAILVGLFIQFLLFNVDYNKTEKVQFEDDDYYYYVKAIPKKSSRKRRKVALKHKTGSERTSINEGE